MRLIGLTGRAGAGKSTVADHMVLRHGFVQMALADPIRCGLQAMFGLAPQDLDERARKEAPVDWLGVSPRRLMQTLGTEWGRAVCGEDVWLKVAERRIAQQKALRYMSVYELPLRMVISDIRFANEAAWVRAQGGVVWHVVRVADDYRIDGDHVSERTLPVAEGEHIVWNVGSLQQLFEQVDDQEPGEW